MTGIRVVGNERVGVLFSFGCVRSADGVKVAGRVAGIVAISGDGVTGGVWGMLTEQPVAAKLNNRNQDKELAFTIRFDLMWSLTVSEPWYG